MRRRLLRFAAVLSLAFCVATLALWVLSPWTTLWLDWSPRGVAQYRVNSDRAGIVYLSWDYPPTPQSRPFFVLKWDAPYDYTAVNTGRRRVHPFSVPVVNTRT